MSLQAIGLIEPYCGPLQPSTCMYKLTEEGKDAADRLTEIERMIKK